MYPLFTPLVLVAYMFYSLLEHPLYLKYITSCTESPEGGRLYNEFLECPTPDELTALNSLYNVVRLESSSIPMYSGYNLRQVCMVSLVVVTVIII
jgi:hypothetical protein